MPSSNTKLSKRLSYVLRHDPDSIGVTLDPAGWVELSRLIDALGRHGHEVTEEQVLEVVATSPKQRFEVQDQQIRAAQGHSIPVELELEAIRPPALLYHGTVASFIGAIRTEGLRSRSRNHVHLSADEATASEVGRRRGKPIILQVDALAMFEAGHVFFRASNGVWLTEAVPAQHVTFPDLGE